MQKILLILTGISVFISCTKNSSKTSDQSQTSPVLTSITGDSADFYFVYENGQVTDVLARYDDGGHYLGDSSYAPYAHLSYDSVNYIKATSMDESAGYAYTEYFLNENKLPLKIIIHFRYGAKDVVNFFYNPQTNLLDSVHDTNDSIYFVRAYMQYNDADITGIRILQPFLDRNSEQDFKYEYDKTTPNIFKTLDPLWYIYHTPLGTYNAQNSWVDMNYDKYAKLFSQNTFTQIHDSYSNYNTYWDTLHYTLNSADKLESEWYNAEQNHVRHYNYNNLTLY
jgi:hypothetical protein